MKSIKKPGAPPLALALLAVLAAPARAQEAGQPSAPEKSLGTVTVTSGRASSLPTHIPTTIEGVTGAEVLDTVNAFDSEDALKYLPSLTVRKRYIGDYDHAVLASRASGTGNSARSLVYADGILLSNLLGNGAFFTPRWALVTPEEIERVDVLYGPFSAAYPGNSAGAVVDYVTRMPDRFEAHAGVAGFSQRFSLYRGKDSYPGHQESASLGGRNGPWAWWVNVNRLDSDGQPLSYANRLVAAGAAPAGGMAVTGAVTGRDPRNRPWLLLGATGQTHTVQDHAKAKLSYDFSPSVRASYTLGWWRNDAQRNAESFLRDAGGNPVYSGPVLINGRQYTLNPADFAPSRGEIEHVMHGLSVKSNTRGVWDWEVAASLFDFARDRMRSPTGALPAASAGGAGTITDGKGTGWNTLALKGTWRPDGPGGGHLMDFGYQRDAFKLRTLVSGAADWTGGAPGARISSFGGNTELQSLYAQDTWRFAPDWRATLGGRLEQWRAFNGELGNAVTASSFPERRETHFSPKAALAYRASADWSLKASLGRAVRMPTVSELYQGSLVNGVVTNNDPALKPERSWTGELSAERAIGSDGLARATLFHETTRDALYAQTNVTVTPSVTNIQNVERVRTRGLELAYQGSDVAVRGLALSASLTYAHSVIAENPNFPASVGKWQPRVPRWRATFLASYRPDERWVYTLGARYSGRQYGQLDNSDGNGQAYTGFSDYLVIDARVRYRFDRNWTAAVGVDNLGNDQYWAFHPYPQRTVTAELRFAY